MSQSAQTSPKISGSKGGGSSRSNPSSPIVGNVPQPLPTLSSLQSITPERLLEYIAYRMPIVMDYHGKLLEQLRRRIADWSPDHTKIGDLFHTFVNSDVIEFYEIMVDHLNELSSILKLAHKQQEAAERSGSSNSNNSSTNTANNNGNIGSNHQQSNQHHQQSSNIGHRSSSKSSVSTNETGSSKFRVHARPRYTPDYLLISTIQRIPRYELLLRRLIKNTAEQHDDYQSLGEALNVIHDVLLKIGTYQNEPTATMPSSISGTQKESQSNVTSPIVECKEIIAKSGGGGGSTGSGQSSSTTMDTTTRQLYIRDLEPVIEGAQTYLDQYGPTSLVHIYDYVIIRKRERAIFVLDDAIMICTLKSKKKSDKFEYNKFKLQHYYRLESIDFRCQCWQHWLELDRSNDRQMIQTSAGTSTGTSTTTVSTNTGTNLSSGSFSKADHHHHHHHQHQQQHQQQQQSIQE